MTEDDNARRDGGLTRAERLRLVDRHVEVMEHRKIEEELQLLRTIEVGQMLNRFKEG